MDDKKVRSFWDENAENWTHLVRLGYDRCRDLINSPTFFKILPKIHTLIGLDVGCGEGYNTRIAAQQNAFMCAFDISQIFVRNAHNYSNNNSNFIHYTHSSALSLPYVSNSFDFVISTMALMNISDLNKCLREIFRVLKPNGFFQFSITHPCFITPKFEWVYDQSGKKAAITCGDYFNQKAESIEEWIFGAAPKKITNQMKKFRIPTFSRTLSEWLNLIISTGFHLEYFVEPTIDDILLKMHPEEYDSRIIPFFFIIRCRKK